MQVTISFIKGDHHTVGSALKCGSIVVIQVKTNKQVNKDNSLKVSTMKRSVIL